MFAMEMCAEMTLQKVIMAFLLEAGKAMRVCMWWQ
jgi:hypothetical protein